VGQNRLLFNIFRWLLFLIGIFFISLGIALMVKGALGLSPWDVFHQGVTKVSGWSMGKVMQLTGVALIIISWVLGYKPGLGTIINMWGIGYFFDLVLVHLPDADSLTIKVMLFVIGVLVYALGSGAYIACQFGAGPRDSLMMALRQKTGKGVSVIRTGIELSALLIGWFLGGLVGLGTVVFSFSIGPLLAVFLPQMETFISRAERFLYSGEKSF